MKSDPTPENTPQTSGRAVPYYRVSTDDQSIGLDAQADQVSAYCSRHGLALAGHFVDEDVTGATPIDKCPGLFGALAELQQGDILLVAKRDRLGRDPIKVAMIEISAKRAGARVVSAAGEGTDADDPTSILMRRIIDAFAEYERLIIRARTRAGLGALRKRGRRVGTVPYGSAVIDDGHPTKTSKGPGKIVGNPEEARIFVRIAEGIQAGLSPRAIARALQGDGIPTRMGRPWHHSTVRALAKRHRLNDPATAEAVTSG